MECNFIHRMEPYALSNILNKIPETITNAIDVVKLLGKRYLWVDVLCIPQDDAEIKSREIDLMGAICANATVTIVVADGNDAEYGIRGFQRLTRSRDLNMEEHVDFGDDHKLISMELPWGHQQWVHSPYSTQGWVFQEYQFSQRRLIFHNRMMRWQCYCSIWHEMVTPALAASTEVAQNHLDDQLKFGCPSLSAYGCLLDEYNHSSFAYQKDALCAVTGLLTILGQKYMGGFLFRLPEMYFDAALNWEHCRIVRYEKNEQKSLCQNTR